MIRSNTSDDALFRLIQQGVDDAMLHIGSAFVVLEVNECVEGSIPHIVRAMRGYQDAKRELEQGREAIGVRRYQLLNDRLDDIRRKVWIIMSTISGMVRGKPALYNELRELRRSFLVSGVASEGARAAGGYP